MKFASRRFKPAQQGDLDGFCGVYCALNFIFRREGIEPKDDRRVELFRKILQFLDDRDKFTVVRVAGGGFRRGQIQAALGKLAKAERLGIKVVSLASYAAKKDATDIFDVLGHLEPNEAAMIHLAECDHWVLAHSSTDQSFTVDDSAGETKPLRYGSKEVQSNGVNIKEGLVFLNAQTH